jgi:CRISPR-associated endonuclease/helicase Cas3
MVQRLGRVNRFGQGEARIIVISGQKPKGKAKKAEEGPQEHDGAEERRKAVLELLGKLPSADGHHTASPRDLRGLAPEAELIRRATTPAPLRPQLDRALVDAWAMTSLKEHTGRPEIQPWLRGWVSEEAQTRLAWRRHIPVRTAEGTVAVAMQPREVNEFFEAAPVELPEMLETETWKVVKWLRERAERRWPERDDQLIDETKRTRPLIEDVVGLVLDPADEHVTTLTGLDLQQREEKWLVSDLVGRTLVLDARLAGLSEDGLLEKGADDPPSTIDDETWGERPFRVRSVAANETGGSSPAWVEEVRLASETDDEGAVQRFLVVDVPVGKATTVDARSAGPPQRLAEHSEITAERAHRLASALGLTEALSKTLVVAARLHDEGKSARAWQEAFGAPVDGEPYAKTNVRRIDHQRLGGYRHELGSLLLAEQDEAIRGLPGDLRDLALHLIAAHHGHARPLMPTRGVEELPPSRLQDKATEIALRFARLQKQWGPWGLAWLESLLRAADHQASAMNDERKESR